MTADQWPAVGTTLTSADPEPPEGSLVDDSSGRAWGNVGVGWAPLWLGSAEPWAKIPGPATVIRWGEREHDSDVTWCPCGHWTGGDYMCLNGRIYGPCGDDNCTGVCDDNAGSCKKDDNCGCGEDE